MLTFPKHAGLDLYVVLFDGEVSIKADDIAGKQKRLWRWNAARVPGLGAMVESKEPTRAIFVLVANAPGGTLGQAAAAAPKAGWARRPAPVTSVELDKQPDLAWGGGAYHARLGFEDGSASLGVAHGFFGIEPDLDLDMMRPNQTLVELTARLLPAVHDAIAREQPAIVLGQGDTTTVLATAMASFYHKIPFGHVEAGLRTHRLYAVSGGGQPGPRGHLRRLDFAPTASLART